MEKPYIDEGGHVDFELLANNITCDHPNDYWPDEIAGVAKLADAIDLRSISRKGVGVQVPPSVHK